MFQNPQTPADREIPIATDYDVIETIDNRIRKIVKRVQHPIRFLFSVNSEILFDIDLKREMSILEVSGQYKPSENITKKVEHTRLQELGFKVMNEYGLNPDIIMPQFCSTFIRLDEGTTTDRTYYPSQKHKGLVFERNYTFITNTKEPIQIIWSANDYGKRLRFNGV